MDGFRVLGLIIVVTLCFESDLFALVFLCKFLFFFVRYSALTGFRYGPQMIPRSGKREVGCTVLIFRPPRLLVVLVPLSLLLET